MGKNKKENKRSLSQVVAKRNIFKEYRFSQRMSGLKLSGLDVANILYREIEARKEWLETTLLFGNAAENPSPLAAFSMLQAISVPIISQDEAGRINSYNVAAQRTFGYSIDQALDMTPDRVIANLGFESLDQRSIASGSCIDRVLNHGEELTIQKTLRQKDAPPFDAVVKLFRYSLTPQTTSVISAIYPIVNNGSML